MSLQFLGIFYSIRNSSNYLFSGVFYISTFSQIFITVSSQNKSWKIGTMKENHKKMLVYAWIRTRDFWVATSLVGFVHQLFLMCLPTDKRLNNNLARTVLRVLSPNFLYFEYFQIYFCNEFPLITSFIRLLFSHLWNVLTINPVWGLPIPISQKGIDSIPCSLLVFENDTCKTVSIHLSFF